MLYHNRRYWCLGYIPSSEVKKTVDASVFQLVRGQQQPTAVGPSEIAKSVFVIFTEIKKIMTISRQRNTESCPNHFQLPLIKNCDSEITKILAKSGED